MGHIQPDPALLNLSSCISPFSFVFACGGQTVIQEPTSRSKNPPNLSWIPTVEWLQAAFWSSAPHSWWHVWLCPLAGTGGAASGSSQTAPPSAPRAKLVLVPAREVPLIFYLHSPGSEPFSSFSSTHLVWFPLWSWARRTLMQRHCWGCVPFLLQA